MKRRDFIRGSLIAGAVAAAPKRSRAAAEGKPALLGGEPLRKTPFPSWPVFDETEERSMAGVLRTNAPASTGLAASAPLLAARWRMIDIARPLRDSVRAAPGFASYTRKQSR